MINARTERLDLCIPAADDLEELHAIQSDPRVWAHFPSLRPNDPDQTRALLETWIAHWQRDGLASWIVRERDATKIIGSGGCNLREGLFWNLGYRFDADLHGRGYATEVATAAIAAARRLRPDVPIIAYLVEHNAASARVAEKVGLTLVRRAPDVGNPEPGVIRSIFADRPLGPEVLAALQH